MFHVKHFPSSMAGRGGGPPAAARPKPGRATRAFPLHRAADAPTMMRKKPDDDARKSRQCCASSGDDEGSWEAAPKALSAISSVMANAGGRVVLQSGRMQRVLHLLHAR